MAIGLGKMFGFNFPENFNFPFISKSIQEFWRRWHISLSSWFKDYLYISLGGNRISISRTYLNLSIVFFITGLWHGANLTFICWGLFHGVFILLEKWFLLKFLESQKIVFSYVYTFLIVTVSWAIFRSDTIFDATNYFKQLFDFSTVTNYNYLHFYLTNEVILALVLALFFSTPFFSSRIRNKLITLNSYNTFQSLGIIGLFLICYFYVASDSYNPFIYFRF
jgi:alginate O-acetyltransferase complex protein AlgI